MSLETDLILDRRRLGRRLVVWRTIAVLAVVACVLAALRPATPILQGHFGLGEAAKLAVPGGGSYVARLPVNGIITDDPKTIAAVAAVKPVVAVMGGTAASAGYMIAVPATRIFARQATITGSIGVLLETGDVSGLLKMLGVTADPIVSGPLKDQPSYVQPLSPAGRDVLQGLVMDMYDQFVGMVAAGRHMDPARVRELADGRAYTGRQALALGLVDVIGGEPEARAWLAASKGVSAALPTQDVDTETFYRRTFGGWFGSFGGGLWKSLFSQGVMLDGAVALWQPGVK